MGAGYFVAHGSNAVELANFLAEDARQCDVYESIIVNDYTAIVVTDCHPPITCDRCTSQGCIGCGWVAHVDIATGATLCERCYLGHDAPSRRSLIRKATPWLMALCLCYLCLSFLLG